MPDPVNFDELMERYARAASYRDEGTSLWIVRDAESAIETRARFTTAFVRAPFRFRFEMYETVADSYAKSLLIHASEGDVRVVSSHEPMKRYPFLRDALKATYGCAQGVLAIAVPLLLARPERFPSLSFTRDDTEYDVTLDAAGAIRFVSESWSGGAVIGGPTAMERRTTLRAELDAPIGDDELRFEARGSGAPRSLN